MPPRGSQGYDPVHVEETRGSRQASPWARMGEPGLNEREAAPRNPHDSPAGQGSGPVPKHRHNLPCVAAPSRQPVPNKLFFGFFCF